MDSIDKTLKFNSFLAAYEEESSQLITCVNRGEVVPKENISKVWDFEDFQNKAKTDNGYLIR